MSKNCDSSDDGDDSSDEQEICGDQFNQANKDLYKAIKENALVKNQSEVNCAYKTSVIIEDEIIPEKKDKIMSASNVNATMTAVAIGAKSVFQGAVVGINSNSSMNSSNQAHENEMKKQIENWKTKYDLEKRKNLEAK